MIIFWKYQTDPSIDGKLSLSISMTAGLLDKNGANIINS